MIQIEREQTERRKGVTRVISVTSGKGGVGKTNTVVNLGLAFAELGKSVLLMDADLGLANINVLLGVNTTYTLNDVLFGDKQIKDILVRGPLGVSIIPAASGIEELCSLEYEHRLKLMNAVEEVAADYDYLLIDTQAGIGPDVLYLNSAASEILVVVTAEPTSLTDAYALIKVMSQSYGERSFSILANNVANERDGQRAFRRLQNSVERFLHCELRYLGSVPSDGAVAEAVTAQRALLEIFPSSSAGLALNGIARKLDAEYPDPRVKGGVQFFFEQLLALDRHGR